MNFKAPFVVINTGIIPSQFAKMYSVAASKFPLSTRIARSILVPSLAMICDKYRYFALGSCTKKVARPSTA
jgi:hypothetical protein